MKTQLILVFLLFLTTQATGKPCEGKVSKVIADTQAHRIYLCQPGLPETSFAISIGRGGTGKKKEHDHKTPLGEYLLGEPRPSSKYYTFVPVGYPTEEQRKQGATGGAIGIHGPPRWTTWMGGITRFFDWTDGCIAVGTDREIDLISEWIKRNRPSRIVIR